MKSYAYIRLPHADTYTAVIQTDGEPERHISYEALDGKSGFVVAPFAISEECPVLLIRPDIREVRPVPALSAADGAATAAVANAACDDAADVRSAYASDFAGCHKKLVSGAFRKIVLARTSDVLSDRDLSPETLFLRACHMYPRMCVMLVSTPFSGTWLAATPETLLEGGGDSWRTVALAGTMKLEGDALKFDNPPLGDGDAAASGIVWSSKNIEEQRYVATFIGNCITRFAGSWAESGPMTVRAANMVHLRSDFTFTLDDAYHLGRVIAALHPTPAVCGLPKAETWRHIVMNEHIRRRYYSGFMGLLEPYGTTSLYVSLRCMEILDERRFRLYAGGGLLKDSDEELEWNETETKLDTILKVIEWG